MLLLPLQRKFGWSTAFINRYGVRKVSLSALALIAAGLGLSMLMSRLWQLLALWGVMLGIGTGLTALVLAATIAARWFHTRRGLIVGLLTASSATGQLIFLPMLARVTARAGWRSALSIICCLLAAAAVLVWLLMRDRPADVGLLPFGQSVNDAPAGTRVASGSIAGVALRTLREASRNRTFWILFSTFFICGASTNGLIQTHFIPFCSDRGLSEITAAGVLATMGVFDFAIAVKEFGREKSNLVFGWVFAGHQLGAAAAALGAGLSRTALASYFPAFVVAGVVCVAAAGLTLRLGTPLRPAA